jgi:hypothetical protein
MLALPAAAQVRYGVRAGLAYSALTQRIDLDYRPGARLGFSIAGLADIPFYRRFSFRPELSLAFQGGAYLSRPDESGAYQAHAKYGGYAIQLPLDVAFNIPMPAGVKLAVYGGPALDFHLFGETTIKGMGESPAPDVVKKDPDAFDLGANVGISVEYRKVFFSIAVLCGTFDRRAVKHEGEYPVFQNNATFSLGYFFR